MLQVGLTMLVGLVLLYIGIDYKIQQLFKDYTGESSQIESFRVFVLLLCLVIFVLSIIIIFLTQKHMFKNISQVTKNLSQEDTANVSNLNEKDELKIHEDNINQIQQKINTFVGEVKELASITTATSEEIRLSSNDMGAISKRITL